MDLTGAAALVTGAASGLGRATTEALLEAGARVVGLDLPDTAGAQLADQWRQRYPDAARFAPADVTDDGQVEAAVELAAELGELRVVVCCAGVATGARIIGRSGPHPVDLFRRTVEINLVGTFNVLRLAAGRMAHAQPVDGERGVMVTTASVAAFDGQVGQAAYSASKGAVAAMTLPLARDLADSAIRVMSIAPGTFDTPMLAGLASNTVRSLATQAPHPSRPGRPEEFAALVLHIVRNPMLNGEVIRLDGALRMAPR